MSFEQLNLHPKLLKAIEAARFTQPTPIQSEAIPAVLGGRDLVASAQTGTGKTAAFVLPILQRLLTTPQPKHGSPRALILTPTRELALQVNQNIEQFGRFARVSCGTLVGGMPYPPQIRMLSKPLDILVCTPGRLMDHMERGRVDLSKLEVLVLDEADRMLDMGFIDDVRVIAGATPKSRQTLLFSATLEGKVRAITRELLNDPVQIQQAFNHEQHAAIEQQVFYADNSRHKMSLLNHFLNGHDLQQAVVFVATKRGAEEMAKSLADQGHACEALHGDMNQGKRKRTVERMRRGNFRVLVATDVAARGLDIKGISHVINYELPMVAEDYIHRIGRTGRGGAEGTAISLVGPGDRRNLVGIERLTKRKLKSSVIPGLEPELREIHSRPHRKKPAYGASKGPSGKLPTRRNQKPRRDKRGGRNLHA